MIARNILNIELRRRTFIAASFALGAGTGVRAADLYPSRPIELVVPYGPGGASDVIARAIAEPLQHALGQPVVILNRAGGNTAIAGAQLARSRNDGYHLMLADVALLLNAAIRTTSPGYNPETDFQPVSMVGSGPMVLLVPEKGASTLAEFLARGKDKGITIGSSGQGSLGHLAGELPGPVHAIPGGRVASQKRHAQGAKRSRGRPPARLRNAAHGVFGRNPAGERAQSGATHRYPPCPHINAGCGGRLD